jgi:intracellular sulfur oxidation DsrE/DsrF family protein
MDKQQTGDQESRVTRRLALGQIGVGVAGAASMIAVGRSTAAQEATPEPVRDVAPDFKVVLHVGQGQNWPYVLSNLRNLTAEWSEAHLRVVVDGDAVLLLSGWNAITDELDTLVETGVELHVCPNALHEHKVEPHRFQRMPTRHSAELWRSYRPSTKDSFT